MSLQYTKPTHSEQSILAMPTKPAFGYYGAKQRIARQIIDMLPPHNAWVEGFCGSAAITLAKQPAPIEVINDLDGQIINLFRQLRTNSKALCEAVALTPYAKEEFEIARKGPKEGDPLERARQFLVATMMAVNATVGTGNCGFSNSPSFSRGGKEARVNRWYNLPERLEKVVERLRGIRIEQRDARSVIKLFSNRPATLIYLDPPYFTKRHHGYTIDARDQEFHEEFLGVCQKAKCMLLISGYDNELYDHLLTTDRGWKRHVINTHTRNTRGKTFNRNEVLWSNRQFNKAKSENKLPLRLTKKEIKERKLNPPRGN